MKTIITEDSGKMSEYAAELVSAAISANPHALLSFPGGDTAIGMLKIFCNRVQSGIIDPSLLRFVQLDDWVGIGPEDEGSCAHFVRTHLLEPMGKPFADCFLFDGRAKDIDEQLHAQDVFIRRYGPIDMEVLGIGLNGHLGFNENGVDFSLRSHRTPLSKTTRTVQKKYFGGRDLPLTEGITQGIAQIMESKRVLLLACGEHKAKIIAQTLTGPITRDVPASVLQTHPNAICLIDQAAASELPKNYPAERIE